LDYAELMYLWEHGASRLPKPRADFQQGSHIDTLPIEENRRGTTGVMMPADYLMRGARLASLPREVLTAEFEAS
jgi:hypothetical protein